MKKLFCSFVVIALLLSSCSLKDDLSSAVNVFQCEYNYHSLSDVSLAGINLNNGVSLFDTPKFLTLFQNESTTLPLDLTLNIGIHNPTESKAALCELDYLLQVDGVQFTSGMIQNNLEIGAGEDRVLPMLLQFDLSSLLQQSSKDVAVKFGKNLAGIGTQASNIRILLKPSFRVGTAVLTAPDYFPVDFSIGN